MFKIADHARSPKNIKIIVLIKLRLVSFCAFVILSFDVEPPLVQISFDVKLPPVQV